MANNKRGPKPLTDEQLRERCTCEPPIDIYAAGHLKGCPIVWWQRNWGLTQAARETGARELGALLDAARRHWANGARPC